MPTKKDKAKVAEEVSTGTAAKRLNADQGTARITIVGVGGAGCNTVQHLIDSGLRVAGFICVNTDAQALRLITTACKIQIGERLTKGLGTGGDLSVGRDAMLESIAAVKEHLAGADMIVVAAGMGGGTGTAAAPIIAQAAKETGSLTVGVVTKPFGFEGAKRMAVAEAGIAELRRHVDRLIVISGDRLLALALPSAHFSAILRDANDILHRAVKNVSAEYQKIQPCWRLPGMPGHILKTMESCFSGVVDEGMETGMVAPDARQPIDMLFRSATPSRSLAAYSLEELIAEIVNRMPKAEVVLRCNKASQRGYRGIPMGRTPARRR